MVRAEPAGSIPSLDGLRCVAILPVFLSHALTVSGTPNFIPGNFGVTLFFFLSGYLITTLMRLELEQSGSVSFRLFYLRRALRIFPTFYLVLGLAALYGWYSGTMDAWWLLGQAAHLTNYLIIAGTWMAPIAPFTDVYWSLAVEEHFYLAFPILFVGLASVGRRGHRAAILLFSCVLILLWRCLLVFGLDADPDRTYVATDTRIDSILFGCALALWGNPALDPTRFGKSTWKRVLLPLAVLGLLCSFVLGDRAFRETFGYSLQGVCLFAVFVAAVRYPQWGPMRLLNSRPVRWIGAASFAIYLIHPAVLHISKQLVGASLPLLLPAATVLTLAGAAALYYGIERPIGRLRRRLHAPARSPDGRAARNVPNPMRNP